MTPRSQPAAPRGPSHWELSQELQAETRWIAQLAEPLPCGDPEQDQRTIADREHCLAAEAGQREALARSEG